MLANQIFEKLYIEFEDECMGRCHLMVNDHHGYEKWYKERLFRLCYEYYKEAINMEVPKLEGILEAVKRAIFNEDYIKMFPVHLQGQIRSGTKTYAGSNIEAIFNVVALSVHRYLIELNTKKDNESQM